MEKTIDTKITELDKFPNTISVHEEVYIYRRLADIYDPAAIAILNAEKEVIGYLDRNVAENTILPEIKKGVKFRCFVTGTADEEGIPISITEADDIEANPQKGSVSEIPTTSLQFTDKEFGDEETDELEDEEGIEYPDLDKLKVDKNEGDDDDDWD